MIEIHSYHDLLVAVRDRMSTARPLIVLDGAMGSGKTHLSMQLARDVGGLRISTDCYLVAGSGGSYTQRLAMDFLGNDIFRLREQVPVILFEGICARDILGKLKLQWTTSIYVKCLATSTIWHFLHHLEDFHETAQADEPSRSDFTYHLAARPHEQADFLFVRVAD